MRDCLVPVPCLLLATRVSMSTSNFTDGNFERCVNCVTLARNRGSPMQPHSFSRQMSAWDETGAGLFGEALRAFIPAASSLRMRRYDVRAEILGRARFPS